MRSYLDGVGAFFDLGGPSGESLAADVHAELARAYSNLRVRLPRLHAIVSHYPRPDLPGKCFALVTAFYDVPDPHIVQHQPSYQGFLMRDRRGRPLHGAILEVRQVWQTEDGEPRLIEATVEVTDGLTAPGDRALTSNLFRNARVSDLTCDKTRGGHFAVYGHGDRRGWIWCDLSFGVGATQPWSAAYRVSPRRKLETNLPRAMTEALREFAIRF